MPGFGIHMCGWPEEAEEVAAEKIKEASKKRLLGNIFPARESWYRRKCLSRVYFMCPLIILISLAVLKTKILPTIKMHSYVSTFESTTCITESSNLTDVMLPCDCRKSKKAPECVKEYPCFQLRVTIKTIKGHKVTTYLYEDMGALSHKYENCAVLEPRCKKSDPAHTVDSLASHYGDPGSSFTCLYNSHEPSEVILHVAPLPGSFWAMLVVVCILILAGLAAPIIAYLTCGCMYVCTRKPPKDIQEEVDRRASGDPEMPEEEEAEEAPPEEPPAEPSPSPAPQEQPAVQQPLLQPQYQPSQSPVPPMYNPALFGQPQPAGYVSAFHVPGTGAPGAPVIPVYGSPALGVSSRPASPTYQLVPAPSPAAPLILYVHPGGVISLHPPAGTSPVSFQPIPQSQSPGPNNERKDTTSPVLFYQ